MEDVPDKPYAELLNRIRVGEHTQQDLDLLKTRVRDAKHPDLKKADLYIVCKRKECAKLNLDYLNSLKGELLQIKAKHHHATQKNTNHGLNQKKGQSLQHNFLMN